MAVDIQDYPAVGVFRLVGTIDNTTASPTVIITWASGARGPYKQVDNTSGNDTLITELYMTITADGAETGLDETFYLTGGAVVSGETRQVSYTATYRGLLNSLDVLTPTAGYSRNYKSHENDALCVANEVPLLKYQDNRFESATTTQEETSGAAFDVNDQVSEHTDGKFYKYHFTNYPNWRGTALTAATGADESFSLAKPGYIVPGFSGLTPGANQYAENTGATTETSSSTTKYIGYARTATTIQLEASSPAVTEASQVEAEEGTVQGVFMSPLRSKQQHDALLDDAETFTNKKLKSSTIVDATDDTKEVDVDASGITTGTTRTITMPDKNVDLGNIVAIPTAIEFGTIAIDGTANTTVKAHSLGRSPTAILIQGTSYPGIANSTTLLASGSSYVYVGQSGNTGSSGSLKFYQGSAANETLTLTSVSFTTTNFTINYTRGAGITSGTWNVKFTLIA